MSHAEADAAVAAGHQRDLAGQIETVDTPSTSLASNNSTSHPGRGQRETS